MYVASGKPGVGWKYKDGLCYPMTDRGAYCHPWKVPARAGRVGRARFTHPEKRKRPMRTRDNQNRSSAVFAMAANCDGLKLVPLLTAA